MHVAVVLEPEEEGGFTARVPSLQEIVSYGANEQEALEMARDAIRLVLEIAQRAARSFPAWSPRIREVTITPVANGNVYSRRLNARSP